MTLVTTPPLDIAAPDVEAYFDAATHTVTYLVSDPAALKVIAVLIEIYCPPSPQDD